MRLVLDFAGEIFTPDPERIFVIGREGDLDIDENPYLHRRFLTLDFDGTLWWLENVGGRLAAHVADEQGLARTVLAPGARIPVLPGNTAVTFQAGATSYEVLLWLPGGRPKTTGAAPVSAGEPGATLGPPQFTESQLLAVLALAEPVLRRDGTGAGHIPTAVDAAARLGWTPKRFTRKVDNVCAKLDAAGVAGLRGGIGAQAAHRREALVNYAVTSLLVTADDLPALDTERSRNRGSSNGSD